jgi:hypothetical protein
MSFAGDLIIPDRIGRSVTLFGGELRQLINSKPAQCSRLGGRYFRFSTSTGQFWKRILGLAVVKKKGDCESDHG